MFHEGDLQSGIALAVQTSKAVLCFVTDSSPTSTTWESDWLQAPELASLLTETAIALRIQANTQEALFLALAAHCALGEGPSIAIILNGQLREHIQANASRDEFFDRVKAALGDAPKAPVSETTTTGRTVERTGIMDPSLEAPTPSALPTPAPAPSPPAQTTRPPAPILSTSQPAARPPPPQPSNPARRAPPPPDPIRAERAARLAASAAARQDPTAPPPPGPNNPQPSDSTAWAVTQRQRLADARRERDRVLAQIEADKAERRARAAARREGEGGVKSEAIPLKGKKEEGKGAKVHLLVRLPEGGVLRGAFDPEATLGGEVRGWIGGQGVDGAYNFRLLLPPQPARRIEVAEEGVPLRELGALPSATLVLVPVRRAVGVGNGAMGGVWAFLMAIWMWLLGVLGGVGGALGLGGAGRGGEGMRGEEGVGESSAREAAPGAGARIRVRTLADQRAEGGEEAQRWYNGNQLSTEPRKKGEGKGEGEGKEEE
ncbi:hypothetical protein EJ06DRAFT_584383 [Trichodelitschia bisporula]|uniref:UBX domain-containing protein n=1 Tax=Trichodelitschia bisporula TaxID=703511 RepID=A0A6G1HNF7_9PEZI|nr:hypothetical protein EJ06DRAFT_584383 [Trichodelitschia bisporula]